MRSVMSAAAAGCGCVVVDLSGHLFWSLGVLRALRHALFWFAPLSSCPCLSAPLCTSPLYVREREREREWVCVLLCRCSSLLYQRQHARRCCVRDSKVHASLTQ